MNAYKRLCERTLLHTADTTVSHNRERVRLKGRIVGNNRQWAELEGCKQAVFPSRYNCTSIQNDTWH